MRMPRQQARTIDLAKDQLLVIRGDCAGRERVLCDAAWLTDESDAGDRVLQAGAEAALGQGRIVIEALGPARVLLDERAAPWRAGWQRLRRMACTLRQRYQFGGGASVGAC